MHEELLSHTEHLLIHIAASIENYNLTKETDKEALYAEISSLVKALDSETDEVMPYSVALQYFEGYDDAAHRLGDEISTFDSKGQLTGQVNTQLHVQAIESILADTLMDLKAAYRTFEESAIQTIDRTLDSIKFDLSSRYTTGRSKEEIVKSVQRAFLKEGVSAFVSKDGYTIPLDTYAKTVVNTKLAQASAEGHLKRYDESNVELVQVLSRPGTCEHCAAHDGMVYALRGEHPIYPPLPKGLLPLHPNCYCTYIPIIQEYLTPQEKKLIDERVEKGVNFDPRTEKEKELYARDQAINRRNNAEKKLFIRMTTELGADNYETLSAFRRAKRANTTKFQELYSNYLSATHSKKSG